MNNKIRRKKVMSRCKEALKLAFPRTIPILAGFLFLGMSYGFIMREAGFSMIYPIVTSAAVFAGSLEFLFVEILRSPFNPMLIFFLTVMVNARHIFYGLSMLDKFKNTGWKKYILIFGLCDESFSINCDVKLPPHIDKGWFMLHITWLNYIYWVGGATIGAILSNFISIQIKGLDFVLTALFLVIFMEQWLTQKNHTPAIAGLVCSIISFLIFRNILPRPDYFVVPAMALMLVVFAILRKRERIYR